MQHDVDPVILEALRGVDHGRPQPAQGGLVVVPLVMPRHISPAGVPVPSGGAGGGALAWRELTPCRPQYLQVRNPTPRQAIVDAGAVLGGGMSARAVIRRVVVPPGEAVSVRVEPLGARWWDQGRVHGRGRLGAVAAALLLQATYGEAAAAWSARTAFWSLHSGTLSGGWALLLGRDVAAAWLPDRRRAGRARPVSSGDVSGDRGPRSLIAGMSRALEFGDLAAHLITHEDGIRDLVILPYDLRLVDQVTTISSA